MFCIFSRARVDRCIRSKQPLDDAKDTYSTAANQYYAENLSGKLFLIHGEMDENVHHTLSMKVAEKLVKANKDFDLLLLPNRNHQTSFRDPYVLRRLWDYFVRHLLDAEPPADYRIRGPEEAAAAAASEGAAA